MKSKSSEKFTLLQNKRARHDYLIEKTIEAGLVLRGTEVKSIKEGLAQLTDAYIMPQGGELFLHQMKISAYPQADRFSVQQPHRLRKLLMHRKEIDALSAASSREGFTLLPLEVYLLNGKIKILVGVGKGKKQYDKRAELRQKDATREMAKVQKLNRRLA